MWEIKHLCFQIRRTKSPLVSTDSRTSSGSFLAKYCHSWGPWFTYQLYHTYMGSIAILTTWRKLIKLSLGKKKSVPIHIHICPFKCVCLEGFIHLLTMSEIAQSRLTPCNPMDGSLPGSAIHGIFQARILEWAATSFSRGSNLGLLHCRQTLYRLSH